MAFSSCVASQKLLLKEEVQEFVISNPNLTITNSYEFMKKMTVIAVSHITLGRKLFPDDAYLDNKFEDKTLKILKGLDEVPDTRIMIEWMKFAFEFVDKQHLRKIILVIQSSDSVDSEPKTLETYTFSYDYDEEQICYQLLDSNDDNNVIINKRRLKLPQDILESINKLLSTIDSIIAVLPPIPACEFSIRLELDEDAPDEIIKGSQLFKIIDSYDIAFPNETKKWKLGKMPTKFTTFTVSAKSLAVSPKPVAHKDDQGEEEEDDEDVIPSSQPDFQLTASSISSFNPRSQTLRPSPRVAETVARETREDIADLSPGLSSLEEKVISCICDCDDDKFDDSVRCVLCSKYQHKSCYNMTERHDKKHICVNCHNPQKGRTCSNTELLKRGNIKADALYRRSLLLCLRETHISTKKIMEQLKVGRQKAQALYNKLDFDGCFYFKSGRFGKTVDTDHVRQNVLHRYFTAPPTSFTSEPMAGEKDIGISHPVKRPHEKEEGDSQDTVSQTLSLTKRQKISDLSEISDTTE